MVQQNFWVNVDRPNTSLIDVIAALQQMQAALQPEAVQNNLEIVEGFNGSFSFTFRYFRPETAAEREIRVQREEYDAYVDRMERRRQFRELLEEFADEVEEIRNPAPPAPQGDPIDNAFNRLQQAVPGEWVVPLANVFRDEIVDNPEHEPRVEI
jgi:hypothetical protein